MRLWVCLVALQACLCHGAADASTIIAAKRSNDFIVVAADSFATDAAGRPREYGKCKIKLLDGRAFFASAGATSSAGTEPGEIAFSSEQEAVRHFDQTKPLAFIADRWATTMEEKFNAQSLARRLELASAVRRSSPLNNVVAQGIFVRSQAVIEAMEINVLLEATSSTATFYHREAKAVEQDGITLWGTNPAKAAVAALLGGATSRSATWLATVAQRASSLGYRNSDAAAHELKSALEETIMAGIDPAIGGDVAAIVLERGAAIRWFSRPQMCRT